MHFGRRSITDIHQDPLHICSAARLSERLLYSPTAPTLVLGLNLGSLCTADRRSTTELCPWPSFRFFYFETGFFQGAHSGPETPSVAQVNHKLRILLPQDPGKLGRQMCTSRSGKYSF